MEIMSDMGRGSTVVHDAQSLQRILSTMERHQAAALEDVRYQADRSIRNRLSNEISSALSDAITIMKKTGDQIRSSGQ